MTKDFLTLTEDWNGMSPVNQMRFSEAKVAAAIDLFNNKPGYSEHAYRAKLEEAITTTDFPYLLGHITDRAVLANYHAPENPLYNWKDYMKVTKVNNFNTVDRYRITGKDPLLPLVPERGEYQPITPSEFKNSYSVKKYGRQFDISWEAQINDDLGAFRDMPSEMAYAAKNTEAVLATSLIADAAGPNVLLYGDTIADCGQNVTNLGSLPLTIANLEITIGLMKSQTDPSGKRLRIRPTTLVVPPELESTARAILTSTYKTYIPDSAAAASIAMPTVNTIPQSGLQLRVNDWLPYVDESANSDATWYLFADPNMGAAVEVAYLRGHETPEICMKASNKVSVSGGMISPLSGDFETDTTQYRVRDVFGGTQLDPRMTYAQVG